MSTVFMDAVHTCIVLSSMTIMYSCSTLKCLHMNEHTFMYICTYEWMYIWTSVHSFTASPFRPATQNATKATPKHENNANLTMTMRREMRNVRHRGRGIGREAAEQQQSVSKPNCVVVTFSCFLFSYCDSCCCCCCYCCFCRVESR